MPRRLLYFVGVMMSRRVRSLLCIGLLFLVSISYLLAASSPVSIQIRTESESVQDIRYQMGITPEKQWEKVLRFGYPIALDDFDSETEFLFVQQAETENV